MEQPVKFARIVADEVGGSVNSHEVAEFRDRYDPGFLTNAAGATTGKMPEADDGTFAPRTLRER
jgi:hypothetical protein